jgi:hypothetical protein
MWRMQSREVRHFRQPEALSDTDRSVDLEFSLLTSRGLVTMYSIVEA